MNNPGQQECGIYGNACEGGSNCINLIQIRHDANNDYDSRGKPWSRPNWEAYRRKLINFAQGGCLRLADVRKELNRIVANKPRKSP